MEQYLQTVPAEWRTVVVVPIIGAHRRVCSNYRGITLLSLTEKVFSRVPERRFWLTDKPQILQQQCGSALYLEKKKENG